MKRRPMVIRGVVGVLGSLSGAGCGGDAERGSAANLQDLVAVEVLRVGSVDDPELAFTWFRGLRIGPDGRIYTLHPQEHQLRIHAPDGRFLGTVGREGDGPGEFRNPGTFGFVGDTLWVLDFGTYAFSYFTPDGTLLRSVRVPIELGRAALDDRPPRPRGLLSDGSIVASPPAWSRGVAAGEITDQLVLRMTEDGVAGDTLVTYPVANTTIELSIPNDPRRRASYWSQPFADGDLVEIAPAEPTYVRVERAIGPEGPTAVTVTKAELDGTPVYTLELPATVVPIRDDHLDSLIDPYVERVAQGFFSDQPPERLQGILRERIYNPGFHPPVSRVAVGGDGSVWLRGPAPVGADTARWTVIGPRGDLVGEVTLPESFSVLDARLGQVWGSQHDDLDVPYIVSFEILAPGSERDASRLSGEPTGP